MTDPDDLPEPDRTEGVPHPRETVRVFGHAAAETSFLDADQSGRLHHAWLVSGPRGIGKATLAWRFARYLLATPPPGEAGLFGAPPPSLDLAEDHPVVRRLRAGADPGLFVLRRGANNTGDRLSAFIRVDEVRKLRNFLHLSAADGGRRVVIVDSADDMNPEAANAILKLVEEPPQDTTFLLVAHRPAALLPTIRSRCRDLRLSPLSRDDLGHALAAAGVAADDIGALHALSAGSVGDAVNLVARDGLELYARLVTLFATFPRLDRSAAIALADVAARRSADGGQTPLELLLSLTGIFLARLARAGSRGSAGETAAAPGEAALLARLAPDPAAGIAWAGLHDSLGARGRHGQAVNLDPAALLLDMILRIDTAAAELAARRTSVHP